ncbi:MAG: AMP-binding protein [Polaromonas sp.]|uniref:AMP-binding protein n=1 Tax=Polaromonas sp. TaxID=1869339 RepID=UPI00248862B1|nr:AMP-binding protein [Polaromonas sp.]MDI1240028.1 AMP-binding protein [Polaromonas sp.]
MHQEDAPIGERTLASLLQRMASIQPAHPAVRGNFGEVSYQQLVLRASHIARGLTDMGVARDEPVLLMVGNTIEHVLAWLGISFCGAVEVPVNPAFVGNFLTHVINDSGASTMVTDPEFLPRLQEVADRTPRLKHIVDTTGQGGNASLRTLEKSCGEPLIVDRKPWDLIAIMYRSGTTGPAKGVRITHAHAYKHCLPGGTDGPSSRDVVLVGLPLFHIGGQWAGVYQAWIAGATAALLERFSASRFWHDAAQLQATYTTLLGAQASFLMAQPVQAADTAHAIRRVSMLPLVADLQKFRERFGIDGVRTGYGMSEASSPIGAAP